MRGEYQHSIDAKGRLFIPAKLRESLGSAFVATKGLDGCLFLYSMQARRIVRRTPRDEWLSLKTCGNMPV